MRHPWLIGLLLTPILLPGLAGAAGEPPGEVLPFTRQQWQVRQGRWTFETDGSLSCEGSGIGSLLLMKGRKLRDLDLSVLVRFDGADSSAGLVVRAEAGVRRELSFYQFEWYTRGRHHGQRLSLMIKNPRWKQIVVPLLRDPPLDRWISFRLRAEGDRLQAFIDGERVFDKRDRTFPGPGQLGLHVFQPRKVRFRELRLVELDPARRGAIPIK